MSEDIKAKTTTDPHEDRWNRLSFPPPKKDDAKSLSKICDDKLDEYLIQTRPTNIQVPSLQATSFSKQNEELSFYSNIVSASFLNSLAEKLQREFDRLRKTSKYPNSFYRFPVSNDPVVASFIINPEQISPLIKASDDRIKALETEMDHRERDFLKISEMVRLLLDENKYLRDHIAVKNKELAKILDTIGLNDGESVQDLRHRLSLLSEENRILLAHMEELKMAKLNFMGQTQDKEADFNMLLMSYNECKANLEDSLRREADLATFKQTVEPRFRQAQEKIMMLEMEVSQLVEELTQVKNKHMMCSNQAGEFRKKVQELEDKNTREIDQYAYEVSTLKNENSELRKKIESLVKNEEGLQLEVRKVRQEFGCNRLEMEELVQKLNDMKNQLSNEKKELELTLKKEADLREKNRQLVLDCEKLKSRISELEYQNAQAIEAKNQEWEAKQFKAEQKLAKLKKKNDDLAVEKEDKVSLLELKLKEANRISSRLQSERDEYLQKLDETLVEKARLQEKENMVNGLEARNRRLEEEVTRLIEDKMALEKRAKEEAFGLKSDLYRARDLNKQLEEELVVMRKKLMDKTLVEQNQENYENHRKRQRSRGVDVDMEDETRRERTTADFEGNNNLEKVEQENQYLRLLLKNTVIEDDGQRSQVNPSYRERPTSVPPAMRATKARSTVSQDLPVRPSNRTTTGGFKDIFDCTNTSISRIEPSPLQSRHSVINHQARRSVGGGTGGMLDSVGVERVVQNVLKKYDLDKPPNIFGYRGKSGLNSSFEMRDEGGPMNKTMPKVAAVARHDIRKLQPMSPDKDHREGTKSVVEEIGEDFS